LHHKTKNHRPGFYCGVQAYVGELVVGRKHSQSITCGAQARDWGRVELW